MKFRQAQLLEYSLKAFSELLEHQGRTQIPVYKIVWEIDDDLVTANTYQTDSYDNPVTKYVMSDGIIKTDRWSTSDITSDLYRVRKILFDNYGHQYSDPFAIYKSPSLLCQELVAKYSNFDIGEQTGKCNLFNVKYLKNNVELPFLLLDPDTELKIVSLISES